jgi:hypothetical protein
MSQSSLLLVGCRGALLLALLILPGAVGGDTLAEYRLKAAFLLNFVTFTEWPAGVGHTLNLCIFGPDPFGDNLDKLEGKSVAGRRLVVRRTNSVSGLADCQVVFITRLASGSLPRVLDYLNDKPVLTVADTPGAARQGVALNMSTEQSRITFEANLVAARSNGLGLSSKLLRLAREVYQ